MPERACGTVALVGAPNVGKSTLLNAIVGQKLAIVSQRPQTTRNRILAVKNQAQVQLVLVDTPGLHQARGALNRFMVSEALASLSDSDAILLVTEVLGRQRAGRSARHDPPLPSSVLSTRDQEVLSRVRQAGGETPLVVALNKIDLVSDRTLLLPQLAAWQAAGCHCVVPISARRAQGVDRLLGELAARMPAGPHLFPEDMLTDRAERWLAGELIREQVLHHCKKEVPHAAAVVVDRFSERPSHADVVIEATIYLERPSQKGIVIGEGGAMIGRIGMAARHEIARLLRCTVHLKLTVNVADDWRKKPGHLRRFGYAA